jgi:hypothetical protein
LTRATAFRGFENVYRIDLQNPECSDRWNFLPACRHNAELAHEAASIILHVEQNRNSSADPFWKEAETATDRDTAAFGPMARAPDARDDPGTGLDLFARAA